MRDALNEFAQCLRTRHARNTKTYRGDRSDAVFGNHGPPAAFTKATGEHHGFVQNSWGFGKVVSDDEYADVLNNIAEANQVMRTFRQELSEPELAAIPS